ncbi:MbnP family copper-binding protein [Ideonella livida]|uniref:Metallo-mystery pair system four-Cys motif protein n=1 Tax=Ideonella livida TaxID=2707176 RepID=A0A7C9TLX5_9BURK|nr:MbnP family copper-binding protein [Ideonella livida]NDY91927.1 metallo-mystery pair system four-Cys motif protein [Ideonella livida]
MLPNIPHLLPSGLLALLTASALLTACGGGDDDTEEAPTTQAVSIEFVATVGGTPVSCASTLEGLGTTGAKAKVQDLRFYVSNVKLTNDKGEEVLVTLDANDFQLTSAGQTVALIDLEDGSGFCAGDKLLHVAVTGTVPQGTYAGVEMTLGVPEALNHSESTVAAAPLDNKDMAWSWQAGRKFVKIEVNPENATTAGTFTQGIKKFNADGSATGTFNNSFYFHLGNTGCAVDSTKSWGYSCTSDNTRTFHLHGFDPQKQRITVDLKALFALSNLVEEHGGAGGCMSGGTDPECQAMWSVIGSSFDASGNSVQDSENEFFHGHTIFRALAK